MRGTLTPALQCAPGKSTLYLFDLGAAQPRLGASTLLQAHAVLGAAPPDLDDAATFRRGLEWLAQARVAGLIRAWHDRSDGGSLVAALEMAFASRVGLQLEIDEIRRRLGV